ncbi:unnamed protein product [Ambrosiozyma monospora]|uniref:Unnamed protein product n=1 Tax=Ambrosiozyma monospora TaxID=43982 RepID=A0ACB5TB22_AMBMO|nr:unnamed protein product [Ambrosiozyma monospora]
MPEGYSDKTTEVDSDSRTDLEKRKLKTKKAKAGAAKNSDVDPNLTDSPDEAPANVGVVIESSVNSCSTNSGSESAYAENGIIIGVPHMLWSTNCITIQNFQEKQDQLISWAISNYHHQNVMAFKQEDMPMEDYAEKFARMVECAGNPKEILPTFAPPPWNPHIQIWKSGNLEVEVKSRCNGVLSQVHDKARNYYSLTLMTQVCKRVRQESA